MAIEKTGSHACFGGENTVFKHQSAAVGGSMSVTAYLPPQANDGGKQGGKLPALLYLAGLTCDHTTFMVKGGAQRLAAKYGFVLVAPDTSPRDKRHPGDDETYDFGQGASFYLDATRAPWCDGYRMGSYVAEELPALIEAHFPVDPARWGVFGHSMGGHGALVAALRHPDKFETVSAFAPVAAPSSCPWGEKAFTHYLGPDRARWAEWDATELIKAGRKTSRILIDQGTADQFLDRELHPHLLEAACAATGQPLTLRMQEGYDHSYYTIMTFMEDHVTHHMRVLGL